MMTRREEEGVQPRLSLIVAMARNRVIGVHNTLPWRLPEDLKRFKSLTMGHHIIMGRRTYESIGRPLPGRHTLIVSRNPDYQAEGCRTVPSIEAALAACDGDTEVFFVGGANLYAQALSRAQRLYVTEIQADYEGDARFPAFTRTDWRETARESHVGQNDLAYDFVVYERV